MVVVELEIPPRSVYVRVIRLALTPVARAAGLNEEAIENLKIALSEACANAVLSTESAGLEAPVTVTWTEEGHRLVVEVMNPGADRSVSSNDSLQGATRQELSDALMQSLVDEYDHVSRPEGGSCTRLIVNRAL